MPQKYLANKMIGCVGCIKETNDITLSQISARHAWTEDHRFYCETHRPPGATRVVVIDAH